MIDIKTKDLIVLKYSPNVCYVRVVKADKVKEETFEIDLERMVWSFGGFKDVKIGQSRPTHNAEYGIIGVYNRRDIRQLDTMVHDATEITNEHASTSVDAD